MTNVERSLDLAIGGKYENVQPQDFKPRLDRVADAVGWPEQEEPFPPDLFRYPERNGASNG